MSEILFFITKRLTRRTLNEKDIGLIYCSNENGDYVIITPQKGRKVKKGKCQYKDYRPKNFVFIVINCVNISMEIIAKNEGEVIIRNQCLTS